MFGKTENQVGGPVRVEKKEQSFLQRGVRIEGDIQADGDLRVDGNIRGTLQINGALILGTEADVVGLLRAREVTIHGRVDGIILADHRVHLAKGANVTSDLFCDSLVIDEGVFFGGRSHMGEPHPAQERVMEHVRARLNAHPSRGDTASAGAKPKAQPGKATAPPQSPSTQASGSAPESRPQPPRSADREAAAPGAAPSGIQNDSAGRRPDRECAGERQVR